jgi:pimeloyl-ACP methyl ester carboxylesterase
MLAALGWLVAIIVLTAALAIGYFAYATRRIAANAERMIPMTGSTVRVGGDTIRYVEEGEGRPIVFIHGLGGQLHHFTAPLFAAMGPGYRLIAIDRAGSGYSTRVASGARLPEQADVVAGFIDALQLDRPLVVGHSLGGAISLALALSHPRKIAGLALLAPLTHPIDPPPPEFAGLAIRSPLLRRVLANTIAVPLALRHAQQTLDFVFGPQKPTPDYAIAGGGLLGLRPSHFYAISTDFSAIEQDIAAQAARYGEIAVPVGILFGDRDRVLDHRQQGLAMQGRVEGLEVEILEGIGHMPQFVAAGKVADFVHRMATRAFAGAGAR